MAGRLRDPLVGYHMLVGVVAGVFMQLMESLGTSVEFWFERVPSMGRAADFQAIQGANWFLARLVAGQMNAVASGLALVLIMLILKIILRKQALVTVATVAFFFIIFSSFQPDDLPTNVIVVRATWRLASVSLWVAVVMRYGLLPLVISVYVSMLLEWPMTTDNSAWYFGTGVGVLTVVF